MLNLSLEGRFLQLHTQSIVHRKHTFYQKLVFLHPLEGPFVALSFRFLSSNYFGLNDSMHEIYSNAAKTVIKKKFHQILKKTRSMVPAVRKWHIAQKREWGILIRFD